MNNLQIFKNEEFGEVRTVKNEKDIWFVAKDVCNILELTNTSIALENLDEDERTKFNLGRQGETNFINESGLYTLIIRSRKPEAKKFRKWITNEVLPSIRKNGGYIVGQETLSDDELIQKALLVATNKLKERERQLEEQRPKVLFANSVETSTTSILIGDLAKLIKQNGHDIGQNRLFEWLRKNNYLISRRGTDYNMPTQYSMERGLFEIKETTITHADGHISISKTPKVTRTSVKYTL